MGGCSSVGRALVAQVSDLGLISSDFPVLFHIPSLAVYITKHLAIYSPGYIEPYIA